MTRKWVDEARVLHYPLPCHYEFLWDLTHYTNTLYSNTIITNVNHKCSSFMIDLLPIIVFFQFHALTVRTFLVFGHYRTEFIIEQSVTQRSMDRVSS